MDGMAVLHAVHEGLLWSFAAFAAGSALYVFLRYQWPRIRARRRRQT